MGLETILAAPAMPIVVGGDNSINIPFIEALEARHATDAPPVHIFQIDAHLDFVDVRHSVTRRHGNPMRRAAEKS